MTRACGRPFPSVGSFNEDILRDVGNEICKVKSHKKRGKYASCLALWQREGKEWREKLASQTKGKIPVDTSIHASAANTDLIQAPPPPYAGGGKDDSIIDVCRNENVVSDLHTNSLSSFSHSRNDDLLSAKNINKIVKLYSVLKKEEMVDCDSEEDESALVAAVSHAIHLNKGQVESREQAVQSYMACMHTQDMNSHDPGTYASDSGMHTHAPINSKPNQENLHAPTNYNTQGPAHITRAVTSKGTVCQEILLPKITTDCENHRGVIGTFPVRTLSVPTGEMNNGVMVVQNIEMYAPWTRSELRSMVLECPGPDKDLAGSQKYIRDLGNTHEPNNRDWRMFLRSWLSPSVDIDAFIKSCELEEDKVLDDSDKRVNIEKINKQLSIYFPVKVDWQKAFQLKQKENEGVNEYFHRSLSDMSRYTGVESIRESEPYRVIVVSALMHGFSEALSQRVQITDPDWSHLSVNELRAKAAAHERNLSNRKEDESERLMALNLQTGELQKHQLEQQIHLQQQQLQQLQSQQPYTTQFGGIQIPYTGKCFLGGKQGHKKFKCSQNPDRGAYRDCQGPPRPQGSHRYNNNERNSCGYEDMLSNPY